MPPLFTLPASLSIAALALLGMIETVPPEDDFAPFLLLFALVACAILLILIGIGIVIGLICIACAGALLFLGIVSSSALIAVLNRRFSSGLRALHYQALAAIGLLSGIALFYLASAMFELNLEKPLILGAGSIIGVIGGLCVAFILDWLVRLIYRRVSIKISESKKVDAPPAITTDQM